MLFIFGISNGEKKLNFIQTMLCSRCGQFGRLEVYMTYMCFSLFFVPLFRWGKRYYVKSSCCNAVYEIDQELGRRIQKGDNVNLSENDLRFKNSMGNNRQRSCPSCGFPLTEEFDYCPKCGIKL